MYVERCSLSSTSKVKQNKPNKLWVPNVILHMLRITNQTPVRNPFLPLCQSQSPSGQIGIPQDLLPLGSSAHRSVRPLPHRWPWPLPRRQHDQRRWRSLAQCRQAPRIRKVGGCQIPGMRDIFFYWSMHFIHTKVLIHARQKWLYVHEKNQLILLVHTGQTFHPFITDLLSIHHRSSTIHP